MTKMIHDSVLVSASIASLRTGKAIVSVVTINEHDQGENYAIFLSREQLERVSPMLGDYLSFAIRKQDFGGY